MKKLFYALLSIGLLAACDKIEDPIKNTGQVCGDCTADGDDNFATERNVLIEEFTGITCNNCPTAANKIKDLMDQHPGRLFTIGIHSSNFAVPSEPDYPDDFRTEEGTEIYQDAKPIGVPSGIVSRMDYNTQSYTKLYQSWSATTNELLATPAEMGLLAEATYDSITQEVCLTAKFKALSDVSDRELRWSAFLTENKIIAPQKMPDNSKNVEYEHNHVLRAGFNGTWGSELNGFDGTTGALHCETRSLKLDAAWKAENCEVVVFVYQAGNDTREVLQVVATHL